MNPIILYKVHEDQDCDKLLNITRYLHVLGVDIRPQMVIEKCFPSNITTLPTIYLNGKLFEGLPNILAFYQNKLQINNLLDKAIQFDKLNPYYRITDKSTHKNIKMP